LLPSTVSGKVLMRSEKFCLSKVLSNSKGSFKLLSWRV
jgi:hypothetical protein